MPAFDFPNAPVDGQVFDVGGVRYIYDAVGQTWRSGTGGSEIGAALPNGGATGDALRKLSGADQDAAFLPDAPHPEAIIVACSDETTPIGSTGQRASFRMPFAMNLTTVRASVKSATTTGIVTVDVNEAGASVLSTKLTIDATELTSVTAAAPAVISDATLADNAAMTIDIDGVGDGTATGLKVTLIGTRA